MNFILLRMIAQIAVFSRKTDSQRKKIFGIRSAKIVQKFLRMETLVEIHVHIPIFQGQLIEKKTRSITFIVWVLGRVEKKAKKGKKNVKNIFFGLKHVFTSIFQGLFKNKVFRSVFSHKKSYGILEIFLHTLFTALYSTL